MQNECIFVQHFDSNSPKYHVKEDYYEGNFKVRGQGSQRNSPAVHLLHGAQETLLHRGVARSAEGAGRISRRTAEAVHCVP